MSTKKTQSYNTQWAGQFFVAAELTRRGYRVSFTLGNCPQTDLMVVSPNGKPFRVEVKSQKSKNFWIVKKHDLMEDHFYVFVLIPETSPPEYHIMTCKDMLRLMQEYADHMGERYDPRFGGFNWTAPLPHKNRWSILPA